MMYALRALLLRFGLERLASLHDDLKAASQT